MGARFPSSPLVQSSQTPQTWFKVPGTGTRASPNRTSVRLFPRNLSAEPGPSPMTPNRDSSSRLVEQPLVIFSLLRQRKSFSVEELVRFQRAFFGSPARSGNAATQQNTQQARSPPRTSGVPAPVKDAGRRRSRRGAPVGTTPTSGAEETFT